MLDPFYFASAAVVNEILHFLRDFYLGSPLSMLPQVYENQRPEVSPVHGATPASCLGAEKPRGEQ
jgi:hypothetical protein